MKLPQLAAEQFAVVAAVAGSIALQERRGCAAKGFGSKPEVRLLAEGWDCCSTGGTAVVAVPQEPAAVGWAVALLRQALGG